MKGSDHMKKHVKKLAAVLMSGALLLSAVGCGGGDTKAEKKETLRIGISNFADILDPAEHSVGWAVMRYGLGETLIKFDEKMNVQPWLAESWSISDDKLTWTIKVRDNVKFSNGKPLTAKDCKASIERTLGISVEARAWANIESITAEGQTLTIKTTKPMPNFIGVLGDPYFTIIDTEDTTHDIKRDGPICTGPYVMKSFSRDKAIMEANPYYWDGTPAFKKVEIPSIDDPNTRAMALQSGEIDAAVNIAFGDMALFNDTNKYNVSTIDSIRDVLARINVNEGRPFADKKVREAFICSLDRESYSKTLLKGTFTPGGPAMPPSLDFGFNEIENKDAYNVDRAKKLLSEAGWKDTNGDGIVDKDGKDLEVDFVYYSSRAELPIFTEAAQADAAKIGIKVNLKNVDYNVMDKLGVSGDYDLMISNIMTEQAGDPLNFLNMYWRSNIDGQNPQNSSGYSNPTYDALGDALRVEFDKSKRRDIIISMQKIIMDDAAAIIFGYPQTNIISNKSITGAKIQACDYYWLTKDWNPAN